MVVVRGPWSVVGGRVIIDIYTSSYNIKMVPTSGETKRHGEPRRSTDRYGRGYIRIGTERYGETRWNSRVLTAGNADADDTDADAADSDLDNSDADAAHQQTETINSHGSYRPELTASKIQICHSQMHYGMRWSHRKKNNNYTCVQSSSQAETNTGFLVVQNYAEI